MTRHINAETLVYAARTQRGFGYLVGITGSAAGTLLLVQSVPVGAAATWAATFVFGALFVGLATVLDAQAAILRRSGPSHPDTTLPDGPLA